MRIETVNGNRIIVIEVPRAQRYYKPVFVDGNPVSGTYRRNGEGDYHCTEEELRAMYRDASIRTQDMLVLDHMDSSVFSADSIRSYRRRMKLSGVNPEHPGAERPERDQAQMFTAFIGGFPERQREAVSATA